MLVVDFEVGDVDAVCYTAILLRFDALEEPSTCSWDKSRLIRCAHHGVRLSRARLSVRKDTGVVAIEVVIQELLAKRLVDMLLFSIMCIGFVMRPEGLVEGEV